MPYLRRWRLIAVCVGLAEAETITLWAGGMASSLGVAPQVSAPPPFDVFHDLRWLLVFHQSWLMFALGLVVVVGIRSLITTVIVREAWPEGLERPSFARAWRTAVWFTIAAVVLLTPWALLLFGLAVVPLSWLFFTAVPPALMVAVLIHPGAVGPGWWRRPPPLRAVGWTLLAFFVLTADSVVLMLAPAALRPVAAAGAGLFNGWAWHGVVGAVAPRVRERRVRPLAPLGLALVVAVVFGGAAIGFAVVTGRHQPSTATATPPPTSGHGQPVLVVTGFASHWAGDQSIDLGPGFVQERFSYRGVDRGGRPLPYEAADTQQTLAHLDLLIAAQVEDLYQQTHRPVAIVAESEGALVAKTYLLGDPSAPVTKLVMLSPLVGPGRVSYSRPGLEGWGVAAGWGLRGLDRALKALAPFDLSPDSPLLQSIDDNGAALQGILACPVPGVRQMAMVPLADAVAVPSSAVPTSIDGTPVVVVPAFHGGMLGDGSVRRAVAAAVTRDRLPDFGPWGPVEQLVSAASSAWQVPSLPSDVRRTGLPADLDARSCHVLAQQLRAWQ